MSLEQALQENTTALNAMTAAFLAVGAQANAAIGAAQPAAPPAPKIAPPAADPTTGALTFADVAKIVTAAITRLGAKAAVIEALGDLTPGGKLSAAKESDYPAIVAIVTPLGVA